jgi:hypothetical protein
MTGFTTKNTVAKNLKSPLKSSCKSTSPLFWPPLDSHPASATVYDMANSLKVVYKKSLKSPCDMGEGISAGAELRPFPITQASNIKSPDDSFGWLCL